MASAFFKTQPLRLIAPDMVERVLAIGAASLFDPRPFGHRLFG